MHSVIGRMKQFPAPQQKKGKFQLQVLQELCVLEEVSTGHTQREAGLQLQSTSRAFPL